ncbi:MAG TPA: DUF3850 domain-containing protein [Chitinophagales bacterium]|nr:DUF3850 domain-containing protein [Chitinophagales bacterium]
MNEQSDEEFYEALRAKRAGKRIRRNLNIDIPNNEPDEEILPPKASADGKERIHELKCHPQPFNAKWENRKNWELRKNDRDYQEGDILIEKEYSPLCNNGEGDYSGMEIHEKVIYILRHGFGLPEGYVIMSTQQLKRVRVLSNGYREEFSRPYKKYEL